MKKQHKIYLISLVTAFMLIGLKNLFTVYCPHLEVFNGVSLNLIIAIGIWTVGYIISKRFELKEKKLIIYFFILTLISMHFTIREVWESRIGSTGRIIKSICEKSNDTGMQCEFEDLTQEEYQYLIKKNHWLPNVPIKATNINVSYYRDDFLGDYRLDVKIELPEYEVIDTLKFQDWDKYLFFGIEKNIYIYSEGQS